MKPKNEQLELVLKLPANKPPYIGILFHSLYYASRVNEGWVNEYPGIEYGLILEPKQNELLINLVSKPYRLFYTYDVVKYDAFKLRKFLLNLKSGAPVNFGHVLMKNDKHIPAHTSSASKIWVLSIKEVKLFSEQKL